MNGTDPFRLDGRIALVTGSSTGVGLAIARGFARAGATVVLNGRSVERLEASAAPARQHAPRDRLAQHEGAVDLGPLHRAPVGLGQLEERRAPRDPGVVDQHADRVDLGFVGVTPAAQRRSPADPRAELGVVNQGPRELGGEIARCDAVDGDAVRRDLELAPPAVFLASDAASYVTGALLFVGGGMTATV